MNKVLQVSAGDKKSCSKNDTMFFGFPCRGGKNCVKK